MIQNYDVDYLGYKDHGNSIMAGIALVQLKYLDEDNEYPSNVPGKVPFILVPAICAASKINFKLYFLQSSIILSNLPTLPQLAVEILKKENNWVEGDEVITTPITFVSTNHAILYQKLVPKFADVDERFCVLYILSIFPQILLF